MSCVDCDVLTLQDESLKVSCDTHVTKEGVRLYGFIGDDRVQADLVMVDDTVYVFTNVSKVYELHVLRQFVKLL